ncbi:hypothetical protein [Pseudomonas sp. RIT-PI-AD]|uniref:hypothetical protein n=1 Tax=Pseudomonas sp. RIT-PI-AD TaxID=3035294 RepID=UPI0021DB752D|nr:hypothetical protein [Pseudomonas sp. RIT-PI-AD]
MNYAIYDAATGKIRLSGITSQPETLDLELQDNESIFLHPIPHGATHIRNETPVRIEPDKTYTDSRIAEYPSTGEQLDALVALAMSLREQGVAIPEKTAAWLENIAEVKAAYPKETNNAVIS